MPILQDRAASGQLLRRIGSGRWSEETRFTNRRGDHTRNNPQSGHARRVPDALLGVLQQPIPHTSDDPNLFTIQHPNEPSSYQVPEAFALNIGVTS